MAALCGPIGGHGAHLDGGSKVKIKTNYDGCGYLTAGKLYDAFDVDSRWATIVDDEGDEILACLKGPCAHLNCIGEWEVVE